MIFTVWDYFYNDSTFNTENTECFFWKEYKTTTSVALTPNNSSIYIVRCYFENCTNTNYGAAVYYNYSNGNLLVEFSRFVSCYLLERQLDVAGIFAYNCNCIVNCVCSLNCYAKGENGFGQFIYTNVGNSKENSVFESSVCSSKGISGYAAPIRLDKGNPNCTSVNISFYTVTVYSAIELQSSETHISFCSFCSNNASEYNCIRIRTPLIIEKCNIVNNYQGTEQNGIINTTANTTIKDCCILGNKGEGNWKLFNADSGSTITIIQCTLPSNFTTNGNINTDNANTITSFINDLILTEDGTFCFSGIESFGNLTPIISNCHKCTSFSKYSFRPRFSLLTFIIFDFST